MSGYQAQFSTRLPQNLGIQLYWIVIALLAIVFWSYSDLTGWHLGFFTMLAAALYASFSRSQLPLMVYFSTMLVYWVLAPLLQQQMGVGYYTLSLRIPAFHQTAFVFVFVHFAGILAGSQIRIGRSFKKPSREIQFSFVGLGFSMAFLLALLAFIGFDVVLSTRVDQATGDALNYRILARNIFKLTPAILITYALLSDWPQRLKPYRRAVLVFLLFVLLATSNPFNTSRFLCLAGIALVFIVFLISKSRTSLLAPVLAFAPFYAVFLLSITTVMRFGTDRLAETSFFDSLRTLEFSSYSVFINALDLNRLPSDNYLLSHLLIVVPRSLWPDKAGAIGIDVAERSGYVFNNVGLIPFFNAYADYGLLGLFLFSLVFGMIAQMLNPASLYPSFRNRPFVYGVILTSMMPMLFRGDLSTAMLAFYPTVLAYEIVRLLAHIALLRVKR